MIAGALSEHNETILGNMEEKEEKEQGREAVFQSDWSADTTIYLDDGSRVRTHSIVLAAGSEHYRFIAQVNKPNNQHIAGDNKTIKD